MDAVPPYLKHDNFIWVDVDVASGTEQRGGRVHQRLLWQDKRQFCWCVLQDHRDGLQGWPPPSLPMLQVAMRKGKA